MKLAVIIPDRRDRPETWKDVDGFGGLYQISDQGRIKGFPEEFTLHHGSKCQQKPKILKPSLRGGYLIIVLYKKKIRKTFSVHRLVGKAFVPNPQNKPQINHKDGDRLNNHASNLEWNTRSENIQHSYSVLRRRPSNNGERRIIPVIQKKEDGSVINHFESITHAERMTSISRHHIGKCLRGKRKLAGGFIWE